MSLLSGIQTIKGRLKPTNTVITTLDGKRMTDDGTIITTGGHGFVVDTKPDAIPCEILNEELFLGSQDCVDLNILKAYNITSVLSVGIDVDVHLPDINRKFIECLDLPETNIEAMLTETSTYIEKALLNQEKVLVHCNAGVSRSSTVIIGYLILHKKMSFDDAFKLVKSKRECIRPNDGFMRQLKDLANK